MTGQKMERNQGRGWAAGVTVAAWTAVWLLVTHAMFWWCYDLGFRQPEHGPRRWTQPDYGIESVPEFTVALSLFTASAVLGPAAIAVVARKAGLRKTAVLYRVLAVLIALPALQFGGNLLISLVTD